MTTIIWLGVGALLLASFSYILRLRYELKQIRQQVQQIPVIGQHGTRLFFTLRDRTVRDLVAQLNQMIEYYEAQQTQIQGREQNLQLSITGLSHDLRTPLTAINGYTQLLQQAENTPAQQAQYIEIIERSVTRLLELTDNFYELARLETTASKLKLVPVALYQLTEELFLSFYDQFQQHQLQVTFPKSVNEQKIAAAPVLLTRVIQNIIQNALRYAVKHVVIDYQVTEQEIILTVKNDFAATEQIAIEHIFERFYTGNASRNTSASGLGLYIAQKLVTRMHGKMSAKVADNWFYLQLAFTK
ncbi:sensor histidine kinase [Loigolactobacillus zhaoyuanensis]|uniref:histidine kinase n=1 Tax=Loigolactobacillus zhaoyuanensis TaxID=2486017 RepID=A0ABW8UGR8_9LACO|nr:HAMP domain-containing sensor histidine kinase [Loigolactobacillus zhaoyuanensis]